jgi:thymidylate kinase
LQRVEIDLKQKMPFIVVTGIDGTGKTTVARSIANHLNATGHRSKVVWIKSLHTLASLIAATLRISGRKDRFVNANGQLVDRFAPGKYRFLRKGWGLIEFVSILPLVVLKVYLPILAGYTIVADRYLIDTIVMISTNLGNPAFLNSFLGRVLLRLTPKGTRVIYLDADEGTILKRRPDIEYTLGEIQTQLILYRRLAAITGAQIIDTSGSDLGDIMTEVFKKLQF